MRLALSVLGTVLMAALAAGTLVSAAQQPATAKSVWDGIYTEQQAARGAQAYSANCSRCHGVELEGANGKPLVGDVFWRDFQARTVEYLLTYMSKNMPNGTPATLPADMYLDLTAFILSRNQFPTGGAPLTAESAGGVQIVQQGGSTELPAAALARVVGCLAKAGTGWRVNSATVPERADGKPVPGDATRPLGSRSFSLQFVLLPLDAMVGHRVVATGVLMGQGGADGINVMQVDSLSNTCRS
jgi:mono/diheme cytochrome c family protein